MLVRSFSLAVGFCVFCRPYVVTVNWVTESMNLRSPAPEEEFLFTDILLQPAEPPSPLSKKVF
jgi:hypothetical protein